MVAFGFLSALRRRASLRGRRLGRMLARMIAPGPWQLFAAGLCFSSAAYRLEHGPYLLALSAALSFLVLFWRARPSAWRTAPARRARD